MLSSDLRTLGDQLLARNLEAMPIDPAEIDGIVACVRDMERRAMALEAQPIAAGHLVNLAEMRRQRAGRQPQETGR